MTPRRTFLKQSSLLAAGIALAPSMAFENFKSSKKVGLQLYSLREHLSLGLPTIVEKTTKLGYLELEPFGYRDGKYFGITPAEFKKILDANGMASPSGHYEFNTYLSKSGTTDDVKPLLDAAKIMGHTHIVVPHMNESLRSSIDDYKRITEKLNEAALLCKSAGLKLTYHNHDFEFKDYNGQNGFDTMLSGTDKSMVDFEMDLYWVVRAGHNPVTLFNKYPGRFTYWHVKDMSKTDNTKNTEIGSGSIDYKTIFANGKKAGIKHYILEQENFEMDPFESLAKSIGYIQNNLF
ncbi:MAG: sugar phosphate isomerase/epimerase [Flavobacteriales bacterium CG_4_9_14_3_um_filter_40_17]|nr:MAG: sugar phosphate isomerase/epimerase [Flavobacteriales bacterium CG_4_9_14_3_um_filter_40_17]